MSRIYHMTLDSEAINDDQLRGYIGTMRDSVATSLHRVGESRRVLLRPPPVPQDLPGYVDPRRVERAPRNIGGGQHGGGRRRRAPAADPATMVGGDGQSQVDDQHIGTSTVRTPQSQVMHGHTSTGPLVSPVTFGEFTPGDGLYGGAEEDESSRQIHDVEVAFESQIIEEGGINVPNQPRRGERIRKRKGCGTHGHLGGH